VRYRPFGKQGAAASALSLVLTDEPSRGPARTRLIYAALESGINTFEIRSADPEVALCLAEALSAVERHMVLVALRVGWARDQRGARVRDLRSEAIVEAIGGTLSATGLGHLDMAVLDVLEDERLPPHVIPTLHEVRDAGLVRTLAVCGAGAADPYIGKTDFDALVTPFHILSGWAERNRLRRAIEADMPIVGCDFHPPGLGGRAAEAEAAPPRRGLSALLTPKPPPSRITASAYDFLGSTPGWTPQQICLGYALTEPCLGTIQTTTTDPDELVALAEVVERDLPSGLAAQIEMARFSAGQGRDALANRRPGA
jgi:aryl-alcohol dehydrogenase-like predicted oxidoreductase